MSKFLCVYFVSLVCFAAPAISHAGCRGELKLSDGEKRSISLSQPTLVEGGSMTLWHPITMDTDAGIQLTIQKLLETSRGLRVYATYDNSEFTGFITFEAKQLSSGEMLLSDLKGFEGEIAFGPSEIKCP